MVGAIGVDNTVATFNFFQHRVVCRDLGMVEHDSVVRCSPDAQPATCEWDRPQIRESIGGNARPIIVGEGNQRTMFITAAEKVPAHKLSAKLLITTNKPPLVPQPV